MFRIITGIAVLALALWFAFLAVTTTWAFLIHAAVIGAIGIAILLNKNEDEIEEISHTDDNQT